MEFLGEHEFLRESLNGSVLPQDRGEKGMVCMHTKWKKNLRRSSLAALITLALTGSAFAMPSGGAIEQGNVAVSEGNLADVGNGATITTQANSIINWNDFSVGAGETLNFNTAAGALLNRVTSDKVSELLGTMTQTGANPLFVVNPNGIHIGDNATIDAANITLSTLAMSTADFNNAASGRNYALAQSDKGVKAVTIDGGAKIGVGDTLNIYGGKVVVADGVVFNAGHENGQLAEVQIQALHDLKQGHNDGKTIAGDYNFTTDNSMDMHGTLEVKGKTDTNISGYTVNLDGGKIQGVKGESSFDVIAAQNRAFDDSADRVTATETNTIQANDLFVKGAKRLTLGGGAVNLHRGEVEADRVEVQAFSLRNLIGAERAHLVLKNDEKNKIVISGTDEKKTEIRDNGTRVHGGNVFVDKNTSIGGILYDWNARPIDSQYIAADVDADYANHVYSYVMKPGQDLALHGDVGSSADVYGYNVNLDGAVGTAKRIVAGTGAQLGQEFAAQSTQENQLSARKTDLHNSMDDITFVGGKITISDTSGGMRGNRIFNGSYKEKGDRESVITKPEQSIVIDGGSSFSGLTMVGGSIKVNQGSGGDPTTQGFPSEKEGGMIVAGNAAFDKNFRTYEVTTEEGNNLLFDGSYTAGSSTLKQPMRLVGSYVKFEHAPSSGYGPGDVEVPVQIFAAEHITGDGRNFDMTATEKNVAILKGMHEDPGGGVDIGGGRVFLWGEGFETPKTIRVTAANRWKQDSEKEFALADANNILSIYDENLTAGNIVMKSGVTRIAAWSRLKAPNGKIVIAAGKEFDGDVVKTTKDHTIAMFLTEIGGKEVDLRAGGIEAWNAWEGTDKYIEATEKLSLDNVTHLDGVPTILTRNKFVRVQEKGVDVPSFIVQDKSNERISYPGTLPTPENLFPNASPNPAPVPDEPNPPSSNPKPEPDKPNPPKPTPNPEPDKPTPPIVPDIQKPGLDDQENIQTGRVMIQEILKQNVTSRARLISLRESLRKMRNIDMDERAEVGILTGMIDEVMKSDSLSASEKSNLMTTAVLESDTVYRMTVMHEQGLTSEIHDAVHIAEYEPKTTPYDETQTRVPVTFADEG